MERFSGGESILYSCFLQLLLVFLCVCLSWITAASGVSVKLLTTKSGFKLFQCLRFLLQLRFSAVYEVNLRLKRCFMVQCIFM